MVNTNTGIGVSLGLCSEFFVSMGHIQIKLSHREETKRDVERPVYKRLRWWFALLLYVGNALLNLASYAFASLTVLAPTASLSILINALLAWIYFKERLTQYGWLGSGLIISGCVVCIVFGSHNEGSIELNGLANKAQSLSFIVFASIHVFLISICLYIGKTWKPWSDSIESKMVSHAHKSTESLDMETALRPDKTNTVNENKDEKAEQQQQQQQHKVDQKEEEEEEEEKKNFQINNNAEQYNAMDEEKKEEQNVNNNELRISINSDGQNIMETTKELNKNENIQKRLSGIKEANENENTEVGFSTESMLISDIKNPLELNEKTQTIERWRHGIRCVAFGFCTAGVVAWVQIMCKALIELLSVSLAGDNQFASLWAWTILVGTLSLVCLELHLISEMMRIFDAVLIVPIYNSFVITEQIGLSVSYFQEFNQFPAWRICVFILGLFLVIAGITGVTIGQERQSLEHHEKDQKERVAHAISESETNSKHVAKLSFAQLALNILEKPYIKRNPELIDPEIAGKISTGK